MNVQTVLRNLTAKDEATGDYRIPKIIYSDAYFSEMVAYADLANQLIWRSVYDIRYRWGNCRVRLASRWSPEAFLVAWQRSPGERRRHVVTTAVGSESSGWDTLLLTVRSMMRMS